MSYEGDFLHEKGELSSKFEEMKSQTKQTAANAGKAFEFSAKALECAAKGQESMDDLLEAIEGIRISSENISKIMKTIDDIAMQTNLLALNAAVEAAHAGVYGRGFMVVAEEVRSLAGKSKQAADQTKELILESLEKVKKGVSIAKITETEIGFVIENVQNVNSVAQEITKTAAARLASVERAEEDVLSLEAQLRNLSGQSAFFNEPSHNLIEDKSEPPKPTAPRPEPPKPIAPRPEPPKPTPPKPELPRPALPKPELPKPIPLRPTPPKPEPPKPTLPKPAPPKPEPPKPTPPRPAPPRPETPKTSKQNVPIVAPKSNRKIDVPSGAHEYDRRDFGKY